MVHLGCHRTGISFLMVLVFITFCGLPCSSNVHRECPLVAAIHLVWMRLERSLWGKRCTSFTISSPVDGFRSQPQYTNFPIAIKGWWNCLMFWKTRVFNFFCLALGRLGLLNNMLPKKRFRSENVEWRVDDDWQSATRNKSFGAHSTRSVRLVHFLGLALNKYLINRTASPSIHHNYSACCSEWLRSPVLQSVILP